MRRSSVYATPQIVGTTERQRPRFWLKLTGQRPLALATHLLFVVENNSRGCKHPDGHAEQPTVEPTLHPIWPSDCAGIFRASDLLGGVRLARRRAGHRHAWRAGCR